MASWLGGIRKDPDKRAILSWLGGGAVVIAGGIWTVVTFVVDHKDAQDNKGGTTVTVSGQGVASGSDTHIIWPVTIGISEEQTEQIVALTKMLLEKNPVAAAGAQQAVGEAVQSIAQGASEGDPRLQQALALLKDNNIAEAAQLLKAVAEDKSAHAEQVAAHAEKDQYRKEAAFADRNLRAIAGLADQKWALDLALTKNDVTFNNPERMKLGKSQILKAVLSVAISRDKLIARLTDADNKETATLRIADKMSATLNGGGAFDVSPSGPQIQLIDLKDITTWTWQVTPKLSGAQYLILSVDAILTVDGKEGTRNVTTQSPKIDVEVTWPETSTEWVEFLRKWFENIGWLWTAVFVPFGLYFVARWRKWRSGAKPE